MREIKLCDWKMSFDGFRDCSAVPPCSMYSVLYENKLIPDPFYRDNETELTKLSEKNCCFSAEFALDESDLKNESITLCFEGIDTLADITLNGVFLGHTDNMHRVWEYDIKNTVRSNNKLTVHFYSPVAEMQRLQKQHFIKGDGNSTDGIAHLRKSFCMSGWDWAPKLSDMGFYRPVKIKMWNGARIERLDVRQKHRNKEVELFAELKLSEKHSGRAELVLVSPDGNEQKCAFKDEKAVIKVKNPLLWWPHGLGEQPLYNLRAELYDCNGKKHDVREMKIGLRTLGVCRDKDEYGEQFCFTVNGVKFFAMGANYVPEDSILARLSEERTEKLIRMISDANFNCVRVWGGAFYPNDWFYELCDRYGMIVWQDFMFACVNVHMTDEFGKNVRLEAIENINRIKHHACIGLLCGNNEMEDMLGHGYGCVHDGVDDTELLRKDYLELYEKMLPEICREYAPDIFYWPSSPSSGGNFTDTQNPNKGDVHYWGAWHGNIPFESYRDYYFRFCSEFGFESFPNIKTIGSYAEKDDMNAFSWVMEKHQKCRAGNGKILTYLSEKYLYPDSFEHLVYASQLLQADAIRYGVEHFRRFRGRCMGAIYWQLNDCWPVASWSSIDYFLRPKALHYAAKRFFAPVLISAHENGKKVTVNVSSELMHGFSGKAAVSLKTSDFGVICSKKIDIELESMTSLDIDETDYTALIGEKERECFLEYTLSDLSGNIVSGGTMLFVPAKFFKFENPAIKAGISGENREFEITVTAEKYAKSVYLDFCGADLYFEDNFFDISSDSAKVVRAYSNDGSVTAEQLEKELKIQSVFSISGMN